MQANDALSNMKKEITDTSRRVAEARGESNAIAVRKSELELSVGLAKGRLDRKKDVEQFIEDMQAEAHAKRVGDFERLLSALVSEVLPGEKPIGLELDIERGQPSLDIVSRISADLCEDIFEDQGGALTNIVVLGLRMISVVRSGMRKFLVLDEPDCWVKNDRIPAFYSVVKEAARKVGVQCFVISHHDTSQFEEGIAVSKLHGHPENTDGVKVENNPRPHRWQDNEEGLRYIRLINFQGYADETLHLHPCVNALIGDNNIGKSSFVRAFRAVFYADVRDTLIRRGMKKCIVEIGMKNGQVLQWTRTLRKNANWKLIGQDGIVISPEFDTSSRSVPEWVVNEIGIGPIAGLDPHVIKQKLPVFLLDKPGSTRASVLSIGQEASHIRDMVKTYKQMCDIDKSKVKDGEMEMGRLMSREKFLQPILQLESKLNDLKETVVSFEKRMEETIILEGLVSKIEKTETQNLKIKNIQKILKSIPTIGEVAQIESDINKSKILDQKNIYADTLNRQNAINKEYIAVLKQIPKNTPKIIPNKQILHFEKHIIETQKSNENLANIIKALNFNPKEIPSIIKVEELEKIADDTELIIKSNERNRGIIDALSLLPKENNIPRIISSDQIIKIGKSIRGEMEKNSKLEKTIEVLRLVPKSKPTMINTKDMSEIVETIEKKIAEVEKLKATKLNDENNLMKSHQKLKTAIEKMDNTCPLCGHLVDNASDIFNHDHKGHHHAAVK